jgi:hypothetical protein
VLLGDRCLPSNALNFQLQCLDAVQLTKLHKSKMRVHWLYLGIPIKKKKALFGYIVESVD